MFPIRQRGYTFQKLILLFLGALFVAFIVAERYGYLREWAEKNNLRPYEVTGPITLKASSSVTFTSSLSKIAWFSEKTQLHVMDSATRKILWSRAYQPSYPTSFNPDNSLLFAGHQVIDARSGRLIRQAPLVENGTLQTVHWSANGEIAAWIVKRKSKTSIKALYIAVWNSRTNSITKYDMDPKIHLMALSPDGHWLAYFTRTKSTGFQLWLCSITGDSQTQRFPSGVPNPVFFSPDSKTIRWSGWFDESYTEGDESTWNPHLETRVWNIDSGKLEFKLTHREELIQIMLSDDGRWLATQEKFRFVVFDTHTDKQCWSSPKVYRDATITSFTKEGRIYFSENDRYPETGFNLCYWDLKSVLTR